MGFLDGLVFQVSRLTLSFPFSRNFKFSNTGSLVSFILLLGAAVAFVRYENVYFKSQLSSESNAALAAEFPELIFLIFTPHVNLITMSLRRTGYEKVFAKLQNAGDAKYELPLMVFNLLCLSEYFYAYATESAATTDNLVVAAAFYAFFYWLHALQLIQMISVLRTIEKRLDFLNISNARNIIPDVRQHSELVELTKIVGHIFGPGVLLNLILIFLKFISHSYMTYAKTLLHLDPKKALHHAIQVTYILTELMTLMGCIQKVRDKAEAFNNELFKLMRDSKELCSNSKLRLYVTMKQTVNFTACGFFSLGYPLVTSIIAAATTYLVILIQFSLLTN